MTKEQWKMVNKANWFTCFRIDTEWDDGYEICQQYIYTRGLKNAGKECWLANLDNERIINVVKLAWTPKAFWVCLHNLHSSYKNRTN